MNQDFQDSEYEGRVWESVSASVSVKSGKSSQLFRNSSIPLATPHSPWPLSTFYFPFKAL